MHSPPLQSWFSDPMTDAKVPFTMSSTHIPQGKVAPLVLRQRMAWGQRASGHLLNFLKRHTQGREQRRGSPP